MYDVSDQGRVRSLTREVAGRAGSSRNLGGRILTNNVKAASGGTQYHRVSLWRENKGKFVQVSRLVAVAFIPNPGHFTFVGHSNGDTLDDRATNLFWTQNTGEHANIHKLTSDQAITIYKRLRAGEPYAAIATDLNVSMGEIYAVDKGHSWSHVTGAEFTPTQARRRSAGTSNYFGYQDNERDRTVQKLRDNGLNTGAVESAHCSTIVNRIMGEATPCLYSAPVR